MKIFCVGRNYSEHAKEMNSAVPDKPVIFMKPETALLEKNKPFYLPDFSKDVHYETELVFRIGKNGKTIQEPFAMKYIDAITVGIDFTARDLQNELKDKGLPWELSKAFDNAAAVGSWVDIDKFKDIHNIKFSMHRNKELAQKGNSGEMIFTIEKIVAFISTYFTLKKGDLIYSGTPAGVGAVKIGDKIEADIEDKRLLDFKIK